MLTLNIGLDRNDGRSNSVASALNAATFHLGSPLEYAVHQSETENTLVAVWARGFPGHTGSVFQLAVELAQDCIAVHIGATDEGVLVGPKPWGEFEPRYFLTLEGQRLTDRVPA